MAANGTGSFVFIDDVTADKSSRMNSEAFQAILSAHIQTNASELIGRRFTVQMDNDILQKCYGSSQEPDADQGDFES